MLLLRANGGVFVDEATDVVGRTVFNALEEEILFAGEVLRVLTDEVVGLLLNVF